VRIYTKTGDDGTTGLIGGARVTKADLRIEAIGQLDELNACLGLCLAAFPPDTDLAELGSQVRRAQRLLFDLGAELASPKAGPRAHRELEEEEIRALEDSMDRQNEALPPLRNFILPGGSAFASELHLARTVCRRAERTVVALANDAVVRGVIPKYLNRLSDWLFVSARTANLRAGVEDIEWKPEE
jgi:cob(I)alamin adenosyltransferase